MIFRKILIFRKCYFPERKIFLSVWLHFRKCCEKYFLVFDCMAENAIFLQIFHTVIQLTAANSGNQKPQPPKHHHHTTTTTPKIKITQNTKTQIKPRKKKSYSGQIERRRKRGRTIGFGVRQSRSGTTNQCCNCDRDRLEGEVEQ